MELLLTIPDRLAAKLLPIQDKIPRILECGMRELDASSVADFGGYADVLETFASLPSPQDVLAMRPSATLQSRISELVEKNRTVGLSSDETAEWQRYEYLEHLVRLAKAQATARLHDNGST